ncbi:hypothetical protein [Stigmatella aurantiaca]|uniref:Conserved uncharacterized protein n=1 Tax=Stigmatella aurantiaca (strain DW4/3-1) TaxID=378806 RepID=Q099L9_STIAD|nr:hypothetical protein [Stigmatella aurantiaca]ADO75831.1 conserved uncharacterized protein [Stigmatella aurantiaca DW4/3-1]EAU68402.1 hypothetical protein STIAU_3329 [Stigmatella aurantiaca DW4/3-1]
MLSRRLAVASAVLTVTACAPLKKGTQAAPAAPVRITNQIPFDIAVCQAPLAEQMPAPTDPNILVGALMATRPYVMECLVAPTSRGAEKTSRVLWKASASDQETQHTLTGTNLTPEGEACVRKAVEAAVPLTVLAKGAQPVSAEVEFLHEQGRSLSVTFGTNAASDYSGAVRLAQPQWCDCYAPYASQVPPTLEATVQLVKDQATPGEIAFAPAGSPEGEALAACLKQKLASVPVTPSAEGLKFVRTFNHFNSKATSPAPGLAPQFRFFQGELVRNQRTAEVTLALGVRTSAASTYDALVIRQQKTKSRRFIPELAPACAALTAADEKWIGALEAQLQAEQQSQATAQELKAQEASWADAEAKLQAASGLTQQDLANARKQLEADQKSCPKP